MSGRYFREEPSEPVTVVAVANVPSGTENGNWYPACGGTETPFWTRTGRRLLYCWQPSTGNHAYIDCQTDMVLSEPEARAALATY